MVHRCSVIGMDKTAAAVPEVISSEARGLRGVAVVVGGGEWGGSDGSGHINQYDHQ